MFTVGCHLSFSKGFMAMAKQTLELGGSGFQFFTGNPRGYATKEWDAKDIAAYNAFAAANGIGTAIAHAPYVYNLCAAKEDIRQISFDAMKSDLQKLEAVDNVVYNFHPGSHVGQGAAAGVAMIAEALNRFLTPEQPFTVLLETMAGKGTEIGGSFSQLGEILARVEMIAPEVMDVFDPTSSAPRVPVRGRKIRLIPEAADHTLVPGESVMLSLLPHENCWQGVKRLCMFWKTETRGS